MSLTTTPCLAAQQEDCEKYHQFLELLPSGKQTVRYGKLPLKLWIDPIDPLVIFHSFP
jgi:hypothetical protein